MKTCNWSRVAEISITMTRLWTSTWVAARPTPGAAYIVSAMSLINLRILSSTRATLAASLCKRGSGYRKMGNSAMEKLANLIDYMQNLNQYLTSRPAGDRRAAHSLQMGAHHGQNNYIPDFVADSARVRDCGSAGTQGQRPRPLHRCRGRHAVEHRRALSPEPLAMARDLED